jgi:hypothetical protein
MTTRQMALVYLPTIGIASIVQAIRFELRDRARRA